MQRPHEENELDDLVKFPRTRHIFDAGGGVGRDDLVMDDAEAKVWYNAVLTVEEKVDGSNLGISITDDYKIRFQNRSHYVTTETQQQWRQLDAWVAAHPSIYQVLTPDRILFGEWMYARHSIHYTALPDLFLAFDIYDKKKGRFLSRKCREELLEGTDIATVPLLKVGKMGREDLEALLKSKSSFHDGVIEGVYVRIDEDENEDAEGLRNFFDERLGKGETGKKKGKAGKGGGAASGGKRGGKQGRRAKEQEKEKEENKKKEGEEKEGEAGEDSWSYLIARSKIVRSDFLEDPDVTHWSRQIMVKNVVKYA